MTLLESVFTLSLCSLLLGAACFASGGAHRRSTGTERRAFSQQSAELLLARLELDLANSSEPVVEGGDLRLAVPDSVVYRFDGASRRVTRNARVLPAGPFERVAFTMAPGRLLIDIDGLHREVELLSGSLARAYSRWAPDF